MEKKWVRKAKPALQKTQSTLSSQLATKHAVIAAELIKHWPRIQKWNLSCKGTGYSSCVLLIQPGESHVHSCPTLGLKQELLVATDLFSSGANKWFKITCRGWQSDLERNVAQACCMGHVVQIYQVNMNNLWQICTLYRFVRASFVEEIEWDLG